MEGCRDRQSAGFQAFLDAERFGRLDGVDGAGEDNLARAVVIGEDDIGDLCDDGGNRFGVGLDGHHCAGRRLGGFGHEAATRRRDAEDTFGIKAAGDVKRHHLAEAVTASHVGVDAEAFEQGKLGERDSGDGRLGVLHLGEALSLLAELDLIEGGRWEGEAVELQRAGRYVTGRHVPGRACSWEGHGEV